MRLIFTINEPGSFFHLLDSISSWDLHTRGNIKKYYQRKFGLSKRDNEMLQRYVKIRKKHSWNKLDSDFYPSKDFKEVRTKLRKRLTKKDYNELDDVISYFYPNLHKIFVEWRKYLNIRRKSFGKEAQKHNVKELFSEIAHFYESNKSYLRVVYVHLVANPSKHSSGGGANIFPRKHITIEPRRLKENNEKDLLHDFSIIFHEILHLIEHGANKRKWNQFKKESKRKKLNIEILREAIADTLIPDGDLALKYGLINKITVLKFNRLRVISKYRKDNPSKYYRKSRQKLAAMIYPLTKKQLEEKKSLFEGDYVKNCISKYLEMRKKT